MTLKIGIRVANYKEAGSGHINRCKAIRKFLKAEVVWFLDRGSKSLANEFLHDCIVLEKSNRSASNLIVYLEKKGLDLVLVDSYMIGNQLFNKINLLTNTCILLDSFSKKTSSEIAICPHPLPFHKNNKTIVGSKFSPINISELIKTNISVKKKKILISMGTYDKNNITLKIVKVLKKLYKDNKITLKTIITLGNNSPSIRSIEETLINHKNNFSMLIGKKNLSKYYNESLFAIGAPGLAFTERMYLGVPSILIAQNSYHKNLIKEWVTRNCAISSNNNKTSIENSILNIYDNKTLRNSLIKNGKKIVDGKGAERIAKCLIKLIHK